MSKTMKIWLIIAALLVVVGGIVFVVVMTINGWDFKKLGTAKYETNTYEIDSDFSEIVITAKTADIVFLPSEDGRCRVVCYEEEKVKHAVSAESNTLVVEVKDTRKWYDYINFSFDTPKITVYLPRDKSASLYVNGSTGDVDIPKDFSFENIGISASTGSVNCCSSASGEIKIELSTGNININSISAGKLKLSTSTGSITVSSVDCSGDMSADVSTGKMKLSDITCKNFFSKGDTGDIMMSNVAASGSFNIERDTGDVTFECCDASELFVTTSTGDIGGSLLSEKVFFAETDTGRVNVPKTINGGRCELTTSTGDIEITIR